MINAMVCVSLVGVNAGPVLIRFGMLCEWSGSTKGGCHSQKKKGNQDGLDIEIIHLQVNVNSYMYNDATVDKSLAKI